MPAPVPPFTRESAILKVRLAEDAWNSRDPHRVSLEHDRVPFRSDVLWRPRLGS
jgi:nuclear transport factor 2 (NTF2) superfamily protein